MCVEIKRQFSTCPLSVLLIVSQLINLISNISFISLHSTFFSGLTSCVLNFISMAQVKSNCLTPLISVPAQGQAQVTFALSLKPSNNKNNGKVNEKQSCAWWNTCNKTYLCHPLNSSQDLCSAALAYST